MPVAIFRKLIFWICGILMLSILCFIILQSIPGDPVLARMQQQGIRHQDNQLAWQSKEYQSWRTKMKLDLPVFYFSILPATQPNSLLKITHPEHRRVVRNLSIKYGSPAEVMAWHETNLLLVHSLKLEKDNSESLILMEEIMSSENIEDNKRYYKSLLTQNISKPVLPLIEKSLLHFLNVKSNSQPLLSFVPSIRWYGAENRFHFWLFGDDQTTSKGIMRGDFGSSYRDSKPVMAVLWPAFVTTSKLAIIVLFLLYFVSIPLGIKMAMPGSKKFTPYFVNLVFALYAMPSFWIALLMITFLCNPAFLNWFPAAYSFIEIDPDTPLLQQIALNIWYLILPVTCWSLAGIAFLSLQTFKKSNQLYHADFIKTARAKGLSEKSIARNHILPNAAIPAISLLGGIIPAAISGAIVIELIFSISGMGSLIFNSFQSRDYPVIMAVLLFAGIAALIGSGISDLLLAIIDPRVRNAAKTKS